MKKIMIRITLLIILLITLSSCSQDLFNSFIMLTETEEGRRNRWARESADYEITDAKTGEKKYVKDLKKDK